MRQTKGAIGNLLNRYKAVLKKCNLLNTFGSLAVASMLVMGGAGVAAAVTPEDWNNQGDLANDTVLEGTYDGLTNNHGWYAGVATVGYVGTGISVEDNTHFTNNTTTVSMGGALKILNGIEIGDNVLFESNKASDSAYGGGAIYIKLNNDGEQSANQNVTIGNNAKFINNSGTSWGGAIALEYGNLVIGDGAQFLNNKTSDTFEEAKESDGGAIAVWHDPDNGDTAGSSLSVSKALFDGNSTTVGGGAIYNKDGQIAIDSTQFKNNSSNYHGGAISNESGNTAIDGTITVTDSIFENNSSGNGGAIWQGTDGVATITGSTFQNNTAMIDGRPQQGGAITTASKMHISSTTFTDNKAGKLGGAIANVNPSGLESEGLTLADVTFDGNSAGEKGGALYNGAQNSVTFTGTNVFQNNTANEQANDIHNSGSVTVASGTTSLGSGYSQDKGSLEVNGGATLESLGTMDISGGAVSFANESTFVVNGSNITEQAAIKLSGSAGLDVAEGANLLVRDAVDGQSYNIVDNEGSGTAGEWKNIASSSSLIELSMENGSVTSTAVDAASVLPGLSGDIASQVNGITSIADRTNSEYAGVRFLARATDSLFLGNDAKAAVSTIESAARIAFAGAVPQMTKMASDAATNAVVNRLGFANPDNGAKAMNVDGKLVDDKALGLALWIAPLWSNQTGFGMEAGNLDYGYNANLGGISLGADYTWANNFRAGLMFNIGGGYAESSGDLSETTNSMTFWGVGAYGGWKYENFAVIGDVSYTSTWNSVDQDVDSRMQMGDLEADIQASAISAGLRFEYKLETQYLDFIPHVGARYMSINTWGYDVETNGGTVLEGDGFQQNIWTFPVGITFSKELEMNNDWYFKPSVDFTVIPAAGDIKAKEDVRFTGLPYSTEIETQMMDYFTWQGGVGLEFGNDTMSVGVNYTLQAGQNSTGHGVFGMFRYEF